MHSESESESVIETPVKGGIHATYRTKIHINKVKVFTAGTSLKLQPPGFPVSAAGTEGATLPSMTSIHNHWHSPCEPT